MKNLNKLLHITIWISLTIIFVITIEKLSLNKRENTILYLSNTEINLSSDTISEIEVKLQELINLMNLENVSNVNEMSLDGKEIAISIFEQIYHLCGLNLEHNLQGDIQRITDVNGNILYENNSMTEKETLNYAIIIIILLIWSFFLIICICIAKENQLY